MAMIKPFNCLFSHVWCNQYSCEFPAMQNAKATYHFWKEEIEQEKEAYLASLPERNEDIHAYKTPTVYTVTITHLVCDSHLSQLPQQEFQLPWNKQCMLEVDTCRMTACRRGLLPHWHIACHCWMQLSAWEPSRWTWQTVYKLHFCFNDSCFTSNQFNDDVEKAISIEIALRARKMNVQ